MKKFVVKIFTKLVPQWLMAELFYAYFLKDVYEKNEIIRKNLNLFLEDAKPHFSKHISELLGNKDLIEYRQKKKEFLKTFTQDEIKAGLLTDEEWEKIELSSTKKLRETI